ncbi:MAG: D-mannonate oxidoreductase [Chloroflexi bacterium RBG_19FT_COMBO_49_13]|nr:MAG: D-mannonate oxidoreductase [Chloroflexi bacterium RBG_19FT_COMBO_49_13]
MDVQRTHSANDLARKVIVITGGAGVLCAPLCRTLANEGAKIAILDINTESAENLALEINQSGGEAIALTCDVSSQKSIEAAAHGIIHAYGRVDILINGAGGNSSRATTNAEQSFFDLPESAIHWVVDLNLLGTLYACQVFGKLMAEQKKGIVINISSMNAFRPLTKIPAYSAAKAGVSNFTQWLAVHMAMEYSPEIRVNAIAPGFFMTEQNRYLLVDQATGGLSERGQTIIDHTPMGRFGGPEDLVGTILWLLSPTSAFITGIVVPIDGGFSAFSGV